MKAPNAEVNVRIQIPGTAYRGAVDCSKSVASPVISRMLRIFWRAGERVGAYYVELIGGLRD
jgi:hypothetical protein